MTADIDLEAANAMLADFDAARRVQWAVDHFGKGAVLLSSMQKTASVMMHMFYVLGLENEVLFGDTGFHFHETLRTRDLFMQRFKLNIVTLYPIMTPEQQESHYGKKLHLYVDGQPECCRIRKEDPFLAHVRENEKSLVMIGVRRVDGGRRTHAGVLAKDPRIQGFSLHPLIDWTDEQVDSYLQQHDVPVHPLHSQGYPSIGCECCTTPVEPGEDARAGRWRHLRENEDGPQFCGINFTDGSGI